MSSHRSGPSPLGQVPAYGAVPAHLSSHPSNGRDGGVCSVLGGEGGESPILGPPGGLLGNTGSNTSSANPRAINGTTPSHLDASDRLEGAEEGISGREPRLLSPKGGDEVLRDPLAIAGRRSGLRWLGGRTGGRDTSEPLDRRMVRLEEIWPETHSGAVLPPLPYWAREDAELIARLWPERLKPPKPEPLPQRMREDVELASIGPQRLAELEKRWHKLHPVKPGASLASVNANAAAKRDWMRGQAIWLKGQAEQARASGEFLEVRFEWEGENTPKPPRRRGEETEVNGARIQAQLFGAPVEAAPRPCELGAVPVRERELDRILSGGAEKPVVPQAVPKGERGEAAKSRYRLRDALRSFGWVKSVRCCGRVPSGPVAVGEGWIRGTLRCNSPHSCPVCAAKLMHMRGREVHHAYTAWKDGELGRVSMLTLTIAHGAEDDLKKMRRTVSRAFSALWEGREGKTLREAFSGYVRALEVTFGRLNGWHPHLHVLLFSREELSEEWLTAVRERWAECVVQRLGEEARPSDEHGVHLRRNVTHAEYVTKLGLDVARVSQAKQVLEITGPGKTAKSGHYNQWEIAYRAAWEGHDERRARASIGAQPKGRVEWKWRNLWREFARDMLGARALTWSRGFRKAFGLPAREPVSIPEGMGEPEELAEAESPLGSERAAVLSPEPLTLKKPTWLVHISSGDWRLLTGLGGHLKPSDLFRAGLKGPESVLRMLGQAGMAVSAETVGPLDSYGTVGRLIFVRWVSPTVQLACQEAEAHAEAEARERRRSRVFLPTGTGPP